MENNIKELQNQITAENTKVKTYTNQVNKVNNKLTSLNSEKNNLIAQENKNFLSFQTEYNKRLTSLNSAFNGQKTELNEQLNASKSEITSKYAKSKIDLNAEIKVTEAEILRINSIKDVCPTCGQKLIGVTKPPVEPKKQQLATLKESLTSICDSEKTQLDKVISDYSVKVSSLNEQYKKDSENLQSAYRKNEAILKTTIQSIEDSYSKDITETKYEMKKLYDSIDLYTKDSALKQTKLLAQQKDLASLQLQQSSYDEKLAKCKSTLLSIDNKLQKLEEEILYSNNKKSVIQDRLAIDAKINTLVKRDFRGFLLSNVINFIDRKVKEYASYIFGSDKLDFVLDGNNINITYLGKAFENLSGGEKQKVDLIIQFAIRDMMSEYLQFSSNILILDEIFDNLDSIGCNNVINLISKKLNDVESLFIISHHADELEISYDCEMIIEKDSNGISKVV